MRRWVSEPILAALVAIALYTAWMLSYSWQSVSTGVPPSGGSYATGWDFVLRMLGGIAVFAAPVAVWAGLAIVGGFLVRNRGFGFRLLTAWLAAVVLCLPFAIAAAISLTANDGWHGLGAISVLVPAAAPVLVVPMYCVAAGLLQLRQRPRLT